MRATLLIASIGLSANCCGQSEATTSRWSLGLNGSLDRCFRILENGAGDDLRATIIDYRDEHETWRLGWTTGIDVNRSIGVRWVLSTGLQFTDRGFRFEDEAALFATDPSDPALPANRVRLDYREHLRYLSVPLMVHFTLGKERLRFEPGLGVWVDYLLSQYSMHRNDFDGTIQASRVEDKLTEFRALGATMCVDLSMSLRLNEFWSIRFGPRGRVQATALADTPILGYLWEAGCLAGVRYHLPRRA